MEPNNNQDISNHSPQTRVNTASSNTIETHKVESESIFTLTLKKIRTTKHGIKLIGLGLGLIIIIVLGIKIANGGSLSSIFGKTKDAISNAVVGSEGTVTTISEASLEEVFEISELSTAEYAYNAIAYAYEKDGTTAKYYVAYDGTVTAGIDFSKIIIDINEDTKTITLKLPECEIQDTTVDFGSMKYIFEKDKYDTETVSQEAYELCKSDLAKRVENEADLLALAKENATAAVEALVNPWVKQIDSEYVVNIQ